MPRNLVGSRTAEYALSFERIDGRLPMTLILRSYAGFFRITRITS